MIKVIRERTFAEAYKKLANEFLEHGKDVAPRGMLTKELMQETFCIECPTYNLAYIEGRNFSLMYALVESLLITLHENKLGFYTFFNENMKNYSDDGKVLYGAYGYRISDSLNDCINKLKKDMDTRQAVMNIYKLDDLKADTKDTPCTIAIQFTIREQKLNMHVYMRSNDLIWGTPYDVFVFTNLQMVVANTLGIKVGEYYHTATSLHVYEQHFNLLEKVASSSAKPVYAENNCTLDEWRNVGNLYLNIVENKVNVDDVLSKEVIAANEMPYTMAILLECWYREIKNKEADNKANEAFNKIAILTVKAYPFLENFTKRWLKV